MAFEKPQYLIHGCGRYEYHNDQERSHKFWECLQQQDQQFLIRWGKIGAKKPQQQIVGRWTAEERIREKLKKGYFHISGSPGSLEEVEQQALIRVVKQVQQESSQAILPAAKKKRL